MFHFCMWHYVQTKSHLNPKKIADGHTDIKTSIVRASESSTLSNEAHTIIKVFTIHLSAHSLQYIIYLYNVSQKRLTLTNLYNFWHTLSRWYVLLKYLKLTLEIYLSLSIANVINHGVIKMPFSWKGGVYLSLCSTKKTG